MARCVVVGCSENGHHKFPADGKVRRKWEFALKDNKTNRNFKSTTRSRLCLKHFMEMDGQIMISSATGHPQEHPKKKTIIYWTNPETAGRPEKVHHRSSKVMSSTIAQDNKIGNDSSKAPNGKQEKISYEIPHVPSELEITVDNSVLHPAKNYILHEAHTSKDDSKPVKFYAILNNYGKFKIELSTLYLPPMANFISQPVSNEPEG